MPDEMFVYAQSAAQRGLQAIIAGAGGAAHLPGMLAAKTQLPVIGVPVQSKSLKGLDSLLSIAQMPAGVPVATMAIGGAANAALYAARILALTDDALARRLEERTMRIAREEIFGPVAVVMSFEDEEEAVFMANDSRYGLGSAVWTCDVARAHRVAQQLKFGMVWVNDHHRLDPSSPWGGVRDSGIGSEGGWESFHDFTHQRSVTIRTAAEPVDWYGSVGTERLN